MRALLTALAVVLIGTAHAQLARDYWLIAASTDPAGRYSSAAVIDAASIVQTASGSKRVWVVIANTQYAGGATRSRTAVQLEEIDCDTGRTRLLQSSIFDAVANPIGASGASDWSYPVPGSFGENISAFACASNQERQRLGQQFGAGFEPNPGLQQFLADRNERNGR